MNAVAKIEPKRRWLVDRSGGIVEQKQTAALTMHQRHQKYRIALTKVVTVLKDLGFRENGDGGHLGFNMVDGHGVMIDVTLKERTRARIAHITSYPGYKYSDEVVGHDLKGAEIKKVNAKVTYLADELKSRFFLQIGIVATESSTPVYIELPDNCADPEYAAIKSIFATIADLSTQIPGLRKSGNAVRAALGYAPEQIDITQMPLLDRSYDIDVSDDA